MKTVSSITQKCFSDLHELESGDFKWNLPFTKVSIGNFHGSINMVDVGVVQIVEGRFSGTLLQNGFSPEGYTSFALPAIDSRSFWWHYRKVDQGNLLVFPENRKLKCISYDGFHVYTLSIRNDFLEELLEKFGYPELRYKFRGEEKVIPLGKRYVYMLNSLLQTIYLSVQLSPEKALPKKLKDQVKYKITSIILQLLHKSETATNVSIQRERDRTVLRAIEFILASDLSTLSIKDISEIMGVKKRSLEYAFKEYVNVGPKAFIKALILNNFRQDLNKGGNSVSEVALRHGITHMGQLSRDYKLLFGELPSVTLKRVKKQV